MFEKNLTDLVRGIRNNKTNEAKYIANCLDEIKNELRQENITVKANAVAKLSYLQMLGYDISWAAFNIIEVMSSSKFTFKRSGYMTASQCFHEELDVLMLTTNMIRKDLSSQNLYDAGCALNGLSCFVTPDLARDLANDLMSLLVSTKPYLRKKAVLVMYKIFLKFPEALRPAFPRLKDKLEDPDPGVQSAAVNVICELARKNPKNYLSLAPLFFKLMTSSTNNWMLIKIIKLFGALCPLEPRLGKKLTEPLTNLIHSTTAMSLLYECINTVVAGMPNHGPSLQLCVSKLRMLLEDSDQNLKYLGLLAMGKILKCQPKLVQQHKDIILQCLDDNDESIRLRALDLITGMVSKKNLMDIVKKLMSHMDSAEGTTYRDELLSKTIQICSQSDYQYITNFEWYVDTLVQLTRIEGTRHGKMIASQMLDITIRVQAVRPYAVQCLSLLLDNSQLLSGSQQQKNGMCEVLYAAAWVSGEFAQHLADPSAVLNSMLRPRVTSLPGHIQGVYVQNILKLYAHILKNAEEGEDQAAVSELGELMVDRLPMFVQSSDLEVQERACCALQLIKYINKLQAKGVSCSAEVCALFAGDLNPVTAKAQKKVPVPEGLDLDKWIHEPPKENQEEDIDWDEIFVPKEHKSKHKKRDRSDRSFSEKPSSKKSEKEAELSEEELVKRREARKQEQMSNPHYLRMDASPKSSPSPQIEDIPVASLDIPVSLHLAGAGVNSKKSSKKDKKRRKGKKGKHAEDSEEEGYPVKKYEILAVEGVEKTKDGGESDHEDGRLSVDDPHRMLDIDLEKPLEDTEVLPVRTHRVSGVASPQPDSESPEKTEKKPKHRHEKEKREHGKHKHRREREEKSKRSDKKRHRKSREEHSDDEVTTDKPKKEEYQQPDEEPVPDMMLLDDEGEPEANGETVPSEPTSPEPMAQHEIMEDPPKSQQQIDDMDFWLSNTDASQTAEKKQDEKEEPRKESPPVEEEVKKTEKKESKKKEKREKSSRKDKKDKKHKSKDKKKSSHEHAEDEPRESHKSPSPTPEEQPTPVAEVEEPQEQEVISTYKVLKENESMNLTYDTRVNPQNSTQVIASIIFRNLTTCHIKSLELNVLDSLNTKLVRPIGYSSHDSIQVPFQLPPGASNEGQFAFTIESITMSQRLRGTLTYMIKDAEGSTSEKMDFKLHLPCSAFLVATPFSSRQFTDLLGSGSVPHKQSIKITVGEDAVFKHVIHKICAFIHLAVVEFVDETVSLYGYSIQHHHICLLVKKQDNGVISIDGKSSDDSLISNILQETKEILQH